MASIKDRYGHSRNTPEPWYGFQAVIEKRPGNSWVGSISGRVQTLMPYRARFSTAGAEHKGRQP